MWKGYTSATAKSWLVMEVYGTCCRGIWEECCARTYLQCPFGVVVGRTRHRTHKCCLLLVFTPLHLSACCVRRLADSITE